MNETTIEATIEVRRKHVLTGLGAVLAVTGSFAGVTQAAEYTVNSTADRPGYVGSITRGICETAPDSGECTLRAAIDTANAFHAPTTITLPDGTYTLTLGQLYTTPRTSLTIVGSGAATTTVTQTAPSGSVFNISARAPVRITGMTITGATGDGVNAGGDLSTDYSLTLDAVVITNNGRRGIGNATGPLTLNGATVSNNRGGGIEHYGNAVNRLILNDSIVSNNTTISSGGGIYGNPDTVELNNTLVSANSALTDGGGISISGESLTLTNSTVSNNTVRGATRSGGGISITRGSLAITGSTIAGNSADRAGGAVYATGPSMNITDTTIRDNGVSNGRGGGISYEGNGSFTINGSTISGNQAGGSDPNNGRGGGLYTGDRAMTGTVSNTTISGNAGPRGGGVFSIGTLALTNTTVAFNSSGIETAILSSVTSLSNSIVASSTTAADCSAGQGSAIASRDFNLDSDGSCGLDQPNDLPLVDPLLGPLADYGGPTQTHALQPSSPAIDTGGDSANGCPATDQRGVSRPQGVACDIGAFELEQ